MVIQVENCTLAYDPYLRAASAQKSDILVYSGAVTVDLDRHHVRPRDHRQCTLHRILQFAPLRLILPNFRFAENCPVRIQSDFEFKIRSVSFLREFILLTFPQELRWPTLTIPGREAWRGIRLRLSPCETSPDAFCTN